MASSSLYLNFAGTVMAALLLDSVIGDPKRLRHPVEIMGWLIARMESTWNRPLASFTQKRWLGGLMACVVVLLSALIPWVMLMWLARVSPWLAVLLNIWLIATTIAGKGLMDAGRLVARALTQEGLIAARLEVGKIVGRDTAQLSEAEVVRATVETLAENLVDGVISPVFYALIGQAPLAMAYRAVNTLDSMVGYKHARFRDFGLVSARLDDVANWVPARVTGLLMLIVLFFIKKDVARAFRVLVRDAKKHPSPNGGIPEAIVAGGLGVRLGGYNTYHGEQSFRAYLGDNLRPFRVDDIAQTIKVIQGVVVIVLLLLAMLESGWWW